MSKGRITKFFEKRKILFSKSMPAEEIDEYGQMFLEEGRTNEALDFLEKTGNKDKIGIVADTAHEAGDVGVWMRAKKLLGEKPTPEMWEGMAERALALGKNHFAIWAFEQAGKKDRAGEIRAEIQREKKEKG